MQHLGYMSQVAKDGPERKMECGCGRVFTANEVTGENSTKYEGRHRPHCPTCNRIWNGRSDTTAESSREAAYFRACLQFNKTDLCGGLILAEADNMQGFLFALAVVSPQLPTPIIGVNIEQITKAEFEDGQNMVKVVNLLDQMSMLSTLAQMAKHFGA